MRLFLFLSIGILVFSSCKSTPIGSLGGHIKNQNAYYKDKYIAFEPKRLWRVFVKSDYDFSSKERAYLKYAFGFYPKSPEDKEWLASLNLAKEQDFVNFFASRVFPYDLDFKPAPIILNKKNLKEDGVYFEFEKQKAVPKTTSYLTADRVYIVDPLLESIMQECDLRMIQTRKKGDSVGIEIILESHETTPSPIRWDFYKKDFSGVLVRKWSFVDERRIIYRVIVEVLAENTFCPVPRVLKNEVLNIFKEIQENTGIEW